jgi:hypothetical protein
MGPILQCGCDTRRAARDHRAARLYACVELRGLYFVRYGKLTTFTGTVDVPWAAPPVLLMT